MVTAQILKVATEVKDGTQPYRPVTNITLNAHPPRCRKNQHFYAADVERHRRSQARCCGSEVRRRGSEEQGGRSKVFVISYPCRVRCGDSIFCPGAQIEQDIHKWFSPPDPSTNYNIGCEAQYEGTAAWFFEGTEFKDWMSIGGSLLWIHGKRKLL